MLILKKKGLNLAESSEVCSFLICPSPQPHGNPKTITASQSQYLWNRAATEGGRTSLKLLTCSFSKNCHYQLPGKAHTYDLSFFELMQSSLTGKSRILRMFARNTQQQSFNIAAA